MAKLILLYLFLREIMMVLCKFRLEGRINYFKRIYTFYGVPIPEFL